MERAMGIAAPRAERRVGTRLGAVFGLLTVAIVAIVGLVIWASRPDATDMTVATGAGASYVREQEGSKDLVRLNDGAFDFDIHEHTPGRRLVFVVPDGEIEDIGTKFHVVVRGGHTEEISVSEGEVEFRRTASPPMRLIAHMTYRRLPDEPVASDVASSQTTMTTPPVATSSTATAPNPAPPVPVTESTPATSPHVVAATPRSTGAHGPRPRQPSSSAPGATPKATQNQSSIGAITAPMAGSSEPAPPMQTGMAAEDVAYMEVVRMLRTGNAPGAREAARRWLLQYPSGLRRSEMETVAAGTPNRE